VLPLGDSITNGFASSDNNGYRKTFYDLGKQGGPIDMIGSHKGKGIMEDNDEEGWDGFTIDQISEKATNSLKQLPNIILLMAGTNNMANDEDAVKAPGRLEVLLDKVKNSRKLK
jgi:lysophospholipase L1-like esterase